MGDAVKKLNEWHKLGLDYSLSINLSPSHFLSPCFSEDLAGALKGCPLKVRRNLKLEILETTALDDAEIVIDRLSSCEQLGIDVALDDFGTGYSSLDYFRRLPVQEIKIDRSFVGEMLNDREDEMIVGAIIGLSKNFERRVVAEGIEDEATEKRLVELGCRYGQGYHYSRPVDVDKALKWANEYERNSKFS
ncbi:MAG: EAL domain-containing protein [Alteromonadaceae bacterium]|nr:EAL domain-containing protein [Alteromonadaceae bacterium]